MPLAVQIRHEPRRQHSGKVRYTSADRAGEALVRLSERIAAQGEPVAVVHPLEVYRCDVCSLWHVGHRPVDPARRH